MFLGETELKVSSREHVCAEGEKGRKKVMHIVFIQSVHSSILTQQRPQSCSSSCVCYCC